MNKLQNAVESFVVSQIIYEQCAQGLRNCFSMYFFFSLLFWRKWRVAKRLNIERIVLTIV